MGVKEGKETRGSSLWKLEQKAVARVVVEGGGEGESQGLFSRAADLD